MSLDALLLDAAALRLAALEAARSLHGGGASWEELALRARLGVRRHWTPRRCLEPIPNPKGADAAYSAAFFAFFRSQVGGDRAVPADFARATAVARYLAERARFGQLVLNWGWKELRCECPGLDENHARRVFLRAYIWRLRQVYKRLAPDPRERQFIFATGYFWSWVNDRG